MVSQPVRRVDHGDDDHQTSGREIGRGLEAGAARPERQKGRRQRPEQGASLRRGLKDQTYGQHEERSGEGEEREIGELRAGEIRLPHDRELEQARCHGVAWLYHTRYERRLEDDDQPGEKAPERERAALDEQGENEQIDGNQNGHRGEGRASEHLGRCVTRDIVQHDPVRDRYDHEGEQEPAAMESPALHRAEDENRGVDRGEVRDPYARRVPADE